MRHELKRWRLAVVLVVGATLSGCGGNEVAAPAADSRPTVVATTTIVADLVREVAAGRVEVVGLMGAGVDPHLYKASAGDVRRMSSADAIVYNGLHLEGKIADLLADVGQRGVRTLAVGDCVDPEQLITTEGFSGLHDPHIWFDVGLWRQTVGCVADLLVELDPGAEEDFRSAAAAYDAELAELDAWVRQRLETVPPARRVLVTAHDAFGYFGRAYGYEVRGLLGVSTASEAGTSDVQELAAFIAERQIPAMFVETSVPPRYIQALQEAVQARGGTVEIGGSLYSDALGNPGSDAATYTGTVRANVETLVAALGDSAAPASGGSS